MRVQTPWWSSLEGMGAPQRYERKKVALMYLNLDIYNNIYIQCYPQPRDLVVLYVLIDNMEL